MYNKIESEILFKLFKKIENQYIKKELLEFESHFKENAIFLHEGNIDIKVNYSPTEKIVVVNGNLTITGNLLTVDKVENNFLIVFGNVTCNNFLSDYQSTVFIIGNITAHELIFTATRDSVTYIGGNVNSKYIYSGNGGGWLTVLDGKITCNLFSDYIENELSQENNNIIVKTPDKEIIFIDEVIDSEEWDDMEDEDKVGEDKYDYCAIDERKIYQILNEGKNVIK
jgi:hypothetical protein